MVVMKWFGLIVAAIALNAAPARAVTNAVVLRTPPSADASFPFWCDWGYDWDERCYQDFSDRLSIGRRCRQGLALGSPLPAEHDPSRIRGALRVAVALVRRRLPPAAQDRTTLPTPRLHDRHPPDLQRRLVPRARGRRRPACLSGIGLACRCVAAALLGRDRPGDRVGGVRHGEQRPAPQARRGPGGLLHQRTTRAVK